MSNNILVKQTDKKYHKLDCEINHKQRLYVHSPHTLLQMFINEYILLIHEALLPWNNHIDQN